MLLGMFEHVGHADPAALTTAELRAWITAARANNYARDRLAAASTFLAWYRKNHDPACPLLDDDLAAGIRASYPRLYGKQQQTHPPRFLTADEAQQLLAACSDGTWLGSRDQLLVRLGLLGIRCEELRSLSWGNLRPDGTLHWIGKKNRARTATPGLQLANQLARYRRRYETALGRPLVPSDPILCRGDGYRDHPIWGRAISANSTIASILERRSAAAGLGWIAPHDLRRSCAAILHRAKTSEGGHLYDLLDIQQVLDHADPATTMRSYLDHIDAETKANAGRTLDL